MRSALDHGNSNKRSTFDHPKKPIDSDTLPTNGESNKDLDKIAKSDLLKGESFGLNEAQSETQPVSGALLRDSSEIPIVLESESDIQDPNIPSQRSHFFDPDELVGKIFLCEREVDGTIHRAKITE